VICQKLPHEQSNILDKLKKNSSLEQVYCTALFGVTDCKGYYKVCFLGPGKLQASSSTICYTPNVGRYSVPPQDPHLLLNAGFHDPLYLSISPMMMGLTEMSPSFDLSVLDRCRTFFTFNTSIFPSSNMFFLFRNSPALAALFPTIRISLVSILPNELSVTILFRFSVDIA